MGRVTRVTPNLCSTRQKPYSSGQKRAAWMGHPVM